MARKSKKEDQQQMSLFNLNEEGQIDQTELNNLIDKVEDEAEEESTFEDDDYGMDDNFRDREVEPSQPPELITLRLLRKAIMAQNPDDQIMQDFGEYVLPNLLRVALGTTAKGGKYFEQKEQEYYERQIRENRKTIKPINRRSADDQSLNTHLLNGLFPANQIEQRLEELDNTIQRIVKPKPHRRRLAIAGFILHDFEKFDYMRFPSMPDKYKIAQVNDKDSIRRDFGREEHLIIIDEIIRELRLDYFLNPEDPEAYKNQLNGILYIAYNAQDKNDTNLNTGDFNLGRESNVYEHLSLLARLADLLSSIIKQPQDAENKSIKKCFARLNNDEIISEQLEFTYHSISENHGVLTNIVNNAVMDIFLSVNTPNRKYYDPLMYLPTGVIYLKLKDAPNITTESLQDRVVEKIKNLCTQELNTRQKGFIRDGKGLKYADYYHLFFEIRELMTVALAASQQKIKNAKSHERSQSLVNFQKNHALPEVYNLVFRKDLRIDQLAEFGDFVTRKMWNSNLKRLPSIAKNKEEKAAIKSLPSGEELTYQIAEMLGLSESILPIKAIQGIQSTIREKKLAIKKPGGMPFDWYYLAAQYFSAHEGEEDITKVGLAIVDYVANIIERQNIQDRSDNSPYWNDLKTWVKGVVHIPQSIQIPDVDQFVEQIKRYKSAKSDTGKKVENLCSITHLAFTSSEQKEASSLFMQEVYTNKKKLLGSAKRDISSIASIEIMLRQILMSETQEVGQGFEERKYRYLYFYPSYFMTPETSRFLREAYDNVVQTRFDRSLRAHFVHENNADFSLRNYQDARIFHLQSLQNPEQATKKSTSAFKLSYSEKDPITFYFMALPPEIRKKGNTVEKPSNTESWVMPAWLGLAFPMIIDVKTVVSESSSPPYRDGSEFEETVVLDGAPLFLRTLTQTSHFRLDSILTCSSGSGNPDKAPLNSLTAAYSINLDVNSREKINPKTGVKDFHPHWEKLSELAKDFETSPLNVFSYLKRYARNKQIDSPDSAKIRLYTYQFYPCFDPYVQFKNGELVIMHQSSQINHPKKLVELYRKFYKAKWTSGKTTPANAILKPIDEAAAVILKAELSKNQIDSLIDHVTGRLCSLMNRVHSSTAEGRPVFWKNERDLEREAIVVFSRYFVVNVFKDSFNSDRARLAGRQLNLIRDTCEYLYRLEDDKEVRARYLVSLFRKFYTIKNLKVEELAADTILKPIDIAVSAVLASDQNIIEILTESIRSNISEFISLVRKRNTADLVLEDEEKDEQDHILKFSKHFADKIFLKYLGGDRSRLESLEFARLRDDCESFYRLASDKKSNTQLLEVIEDDSDENSDED